MRSDALAVAIDALRTAQEDAPEELARLLRLAAHDTDGVYGLCQECRASTTCHGCEHDDHDNPPHTSACRLAHWLRVFGGPDEVQRQVDAAHEAAVAEMRRLMVSTHWGQVTIESHPMHRAGRFTTDMGFEWIIETTPCPDEVDRALAAAAAQGHQPRKLFLARRDYELLAGCYREMAFGISPETRALWERNAAWSPLIQNADANRARPLADFTKSRVPPAVAQATARRQRRERRR